MPLKSQYSMFQYKNTLGNARIMVFNVKMQGMSNNIAARSEINVKKI